MDYIQNAGFTAGARLFCPWILFHDTFAVVWISPVNQNYEGPRSAYGDAYHGYWIADISQLNNRFGTSDDLKSLSAELHRRGMYVAALSRSIGHHLILLGISWWTSW